MTDSFNKARRYTKEPGNLSLQGLLLFLLPLPLFLAVVVSLAKGALPGVLGNALATAGYLAGAIATRRGLKNERAFLAKKLAVAPKAPLKFLGGVLISAATFVAAWAGAGHSFLIALCFALGAFAGFYLLYGFDPRGEKKSLGAPFGYSTAEVVKVLEEAQARVAAIESSRDRIANRELKERLGRIAEAARRVLTVIEDDPRDLRRARKFLNTYLEGAQKVSEGYARTHVHSRSAELDENFRNVLVTIEEVFEEQRRKLLENDVLDLDVQIEVLATQLRKEGVV